MAKINVDTKKVKEFVANRYEVVALGVGAFLAVVCLLLGVSSFFAASSPDAQIAEDAKKVEQKRLSGSPSDDSKPTKLDNKKLSDWPLVGPHDARLVISRQFFDQGAAGDNRRFNPKIVSLDPDPKLFQLDYILHGVFAYDANDSAKKLQAFKTTAESIDPVFVVADKRMVVVSTVFPYTEQSELFRKALRFDHMDEMFAKGLAPTLEGLIVERRKITTPGGKEKIGEWEPVYRVDPATGKTEPSPAVARLLQTCIYDNAAADKYADVIYGATVTPLPFIAGMKFEYPEIKIPGIVSRPAATTAPDPKMRDVGPTIGGVQPVAGGGLPVSRQRQQLFPTQGPPDRTSTLTDYDKLPQDLQDQLNGRLNWTSPYGTFPDEPEKNGEPKETPPGGEPRGEPKAPGPMRQPGKGGRVVGEAAGGGEPRPGSFGFAQPSQGNNLKAPSYPPANPQALIRFVDVDVESGAQYQYRIAVRIANPNYKQSTKVVAHAGLARIKEFVTDWVETPRVTIPNEYQFYVINQTKDFASKLGTKQAIDSRQTTPSAIGERVPFQIHKFVGTFRDSADIERYVSDWEIAERVLVYKGELIGRPVDLEMIVWNKNKGIFEISIQPKKGGKGLAAITGLLVDFRPNPPIVLLDFAGGHTAYKPKNGDTIKEESATEALLLMPDGSMTVHNSRYDMDDRGWDAKDTNLGGHKNGIERRRRWEEWRRRLEEYRQGFLTPPTKEKGPGDRDRGPGGDKQ